MALVGVLLSGGMDSAVCLARAVKQNGAENVVAFSFDYGQKHLKELDCAMALARYYGVERVVISLADVFSRCANPLLKGGGDIPCGSYQSQLKKGEKAATYVPFRNGLFLSAAASAALGLGCSVLMYGAHSDDSANAVYPDCSGAFVRAMNTAIREGTGGDISLDAPFLDMSKKDIAALGLELKVPFELTWSCYNGGEVPCGKCATCIDRKRAFELNNACDPLLNAK